MDTIQGSLVGADTHGDYGKRRRGPTADSRAEKELDTFLEKRSREIPRDHARRKANEEAERWKAAERQSTAEQAEARQYQRVTFLRHLRRVYTNRLQEVEVALV